jgi:hypothetical protein
MKIIPRTVLVLTTLALATPLFLHAAPASWYKWRSKLTGEQVCSQTPLGDGWVQADGPFKDARCQKKGAAK